MLNSYEKLHQHISAFCQSGRVPKSDGYYRSRDYICEQILKMGHSVKRQNFKVRPFGTGQNIFTETGPTSGPRIVVGAHYETRSESGLGADDNASGVAVVLELLRNAYQNHPMTFVFFDMEENFRQGGIKGSKAFVKAYKKPVKLAVIFDIVGGALMPGFETVYFQFGQGLERLNHPGLEFFHLPMAFMEPLGQIRPRSDYHPFRQKKIPFTFISSGTPWYYHTPYDTPDRLNISKMAALTQCIQTVFKESRLHGHAPTWADFRYVARKMYAVFQTPFFQNFIHQKRAPSPLELLRIHLKVLPFLKKMGPDLWKK